MKVLLVTTLVVAVAAAQNFYRLPEPYTYSCKDTRCIKTERAGAREIRSLKNCQLTCGKYGALWPQPTGDVQLSSETVNFVPMNMKLTKMATSSPKVKEMMDEAGRYFHRNMHYLHPDYPEEFKTPLKPGTYRHFDVQTVEKQQQQQQQNQQEPQQRHFQFGNEYHNKNFRSSLRNHEVTEEFLHLSPFLKEQTVSPGVERHNINLEITVTSPDHKLTLETDESYNMAVQTQEDTTTVTILATSYYGARHGLESLSQLIAFDDASNSLSIVTNAKINDAPKFKFRGLMLDTGRNYYPKKDLMKLLDAMSYNKMNYFHWHITDAASFPMYSNRRPEMAYYGSYSPRKVYYPEDIAEVVQYARLRGINVIPEIDGPAHASAGWEWGQKAGKGNLVLCNEKGQPWFNLGKEPPSGQLNPVNPELYPILGELYSDMMEYFDPEMVHMGGDDVSFKCWGDANEIKEYLAANKKEANSREYFELWNTYQVNAFAKLREAAGQNRPVKPIIHSSSFAENYLDKDTYIVQIAEVANSTDITKYINKGFKVIFSNQDQWRIDCSTTSWLGDKAASCAKELPTWEHFYRNSPLDMLQFLGVSAARSGQAVNGINPKELVLGGEATLWSSETDANGFQAKTWPRVSALAERLWTDPILPVQDDTVQKRLNTHRQRMVDLGVRADPIQPEYCMHDESACYSREYFERHASVQTSQTSQTSQASQTTV